MPEQPGYWDSGAGRAAKTLIGRMLRGRDRGIPEMAGDVMPVVLEACVESAESAVAAARGGAGRVELCANLLEGGTTPSQGSMLLARARISIPIHAMIRPRGGDFLYTDIEREIMFHDIEAARRCGMDGIVFGVLREDGQIDAGLAQRIVAEARPMSVTFHRAFDVCRDPGEGVDVLKALGIDRLLTSGQARDAEAGLDTIRQMVARAGDDLTIMPGGGVGPGNVARIVSESGVREIHVYTPRVFSSPMTWRNDAVFMGGPGETDEYRRTETDSAGIASVRAALEGL